ncbi:MAG: DUF4838 domain-containing protein [Planctomycetota bacterium]|jgi:hypothetical protein
MKQLITAVILIFITLTAIQADEFIVKDGKANAEIIVSASPSRMQKFAAEELQSYIKKISGAELAVVSEKTNADNIKIYIGKSKYTEEMKITAEGLKFDAYIVKADKKSLLLFGDDKDFTPKEPFMPNRGHKKKKTEEWDNLTAKYTDLKWYNPYFSIFKLRNSKTGWWMYDGRGSLNAVYDFLRSLGVRWYMPGELGEIVPKMQDIKLPVANKTVKADFESRDMYFAHFGTTPIPHILWYMRLGLNKGYEITSVGQGGVAHGLRDVMGRKEVQQKHPEYYALWGNKRRTEGKKPKPCLSSEGLKKEVVKYARAMFEIYDFPMISVMPQDGYSHACGCETCKKENLETPERGYNGILSDYVFKFVNDVASKLLKTHPDKKISCFAYGTYLLPPLKIKKMMPNVVVGLVKGRTGHYRDPEVRKISKQVIDDWIKLTSNKLLIWEHYPFTHRGTIIPKYFPVKIAEGLKYLKGKTYGEMVEVSTAHQVVLKDGGWQGHALHKPGFNHLNVYVTAQMYWDADQDINKLLDEYYKNYYGPAAEEMKVFTEYCEKNNEAMFRNDIEIISKALELFKAAEKKAVPETPYGKRLKLLSDFLIPMGNLKNQLGKGREGVPEMRVFDRNFSGVPVKAFTKADVKIDGSLDDTLWRDIKGDFERSSSLKETQTGRNVVNRTFFKSAWIDNNLYFGIKCYDIDMKNLVSAGEKRDSLDIWEGDTVEVMLETQSHSYYQFVINPDGIITDLDRKNNIVNTRWDSGAEVAVKKYDNYWAAEIKIPISIGDMAGDPNHDVVGKKPKKDFPWFFNVCRQRLRGKNDKVYSAFSPSGKNSEQ